jgi:hypothetical protein
LNGGVGEKAGESRLFSWIFFKVLTRGRGQGRPENDGWTDFLLAESPPPR